MATGRVIEAQREWEQLAHLDPLWAILTKRDKQFGKWDRAEFFASGQREIDGVMAACGFLAGNNGRALDFGCGVGRLTRAMREFFGEVYGVDISKEMVRLAQEFTPTARFVVNEVDNLNVFDDNFFDFIYSNIVLQHQPTQEIAKSYIREFVRTIKPGGLVVFQMPYRRTIRHVLRLRYRVYSVFRALGIPAPVLYKCMAVAPMRGISLSTAEVERTVRAAGGRFLRSYRDNFNFYSMSYVVVK